MKQIGIQKGRGQALLFGVLTTGLFLVCAVAVLSWLLTKEVIGYEAADPVLFVVGLVATMLGGVVAGAGEKEKRWINPSLVLAVVAAVMGLSMIFDWGEGSAGWLLLAFVLGTVISIVLLALKTGPRFTRHKRVRC